MECSPVCRGLFRVIFWEDENAKHIGMRPSALHSHTFLKEVSQSCLVLIFSRSKLKKSAELLRYNDVYFEFFGEVAQNCFVLDGSLSTSAFEGSLAELLLVRYRYIDRNMDREREREIEIKIIRGADRD